MINPISFVGVLLVISGFGLHEMYAGMEISRPFLYPVGGGTLIAVYGPCLTDYWKTLKFD